MSSPVISVPPEITLVAASTIMADRGISSIVVSSPDGRALGIITERDVLRAVARSGGIGMQLPLSSVMSKPVASVPSDAFVFSAIGRMDRLKIRHLLVVNEKDMPVGMLSARALLRLRAGNALALGDEVSSAESASQLRNVLENIPDLAKNLIGEGVDSPTIAQVISQVLRDITAHSAVLSAKTMADEGWGDAPSPWCLLILGSGGRGESLFSADQDNAIIHMAEPEDHPWFAELGRRFCDMLNEIGIVHCKGGVMAKNPQWRRNLAGWKIEVERWISRGDGEDILNIDIFLDFVPVMGERDLAIQLREFVLGKSAESKRFLTMLGGVTGEMRAPIGFFGGLKTERDGRLDIKKAGLLPLVSAVRVLAVKNKIAATSTPNRLRNLADMGKINAAEAQDFTSDHALMLKIMLRQQIADRKIGLVNSARVDPKLFKPGERGELVAAFKRINNLNWLLEQSLQ
jgi:signal-transduction protein with cAMP-binding, CBS, and nucleotidyltransferase domain